MTRKKPAMSRTEALAIIAKHCPDVETWDEEKRKQMAAEASASPVPKDEDLKALRSAIIRLATLDRNRVAADNSRKTIAALNKDNERLQREIQDLKKDNNELLKALLDTHPLIPDRADSNTTSPPLELNLDPHQSRNNSLRSRSRSRSTTRSVSGTTSPYGRRSPSRSSAVLPFLDFLRDSSSAWSLDNGTNNNNKNNDGVLLQNAGNDFNDFVLPLPQVQPDGSVSLPSPTPTAIGQTAAAIAGETGTRSPLAVSPVLSLYSPVEGLGDDQGFSLSPSCYFNPLPGDLFEEDFINSMHLSGEKQ